MRRHEEVCFVPWHDATWATRADSHSQGGYLVCAADPELLERHRGSEKVGVGGQ